MLPRSPQVLQGTQGRTSSLHERRDSMLDLVGRDSDLEVPRPLLSGRPQVFLTT